MDTLCLPQFLQHLLPRQRHQGERQEHQNRQHLRHRQNKLLQRLLQSKKSKTALMKSTITFIVIGVILSALGIGWLFSQQKSQISTQTLGRVELASGKAFLRSSFTTNKTPILTTNKLQNLDEIETSDNAQVTLSFPSSYRLRVFPQSLVVVDQQKDFLQLIIKRGDVVVENFGEDGQLFITKDGVRLSATDYQLDVKKSFTIPESPTTPPAQEVKNPQALDIDQVIQKNQPQFQRCYNLLVQKKPLLKGDVVLSLTIANSGKVSDKQIIKSFTDDADFKNCLFEIIQRIQFNVFAGEPLTTMLPLQFE